MRNVASVRLRGKVPVSSIPFSFFLFKRFYFSTVFFFFGLKFLKMKMLRLFFVFCGARQYFQNEEVNGSVSSLKSAKPENNPFFVFRPKKIQDTDFKKVNFLKTEIKNTFSVWIC